MFPKDFCKPIPAAPKDDWEKVPAPAECGEALEDPAAQSDRISFSAAYLTQGLPGAMDRCLLRRGLAQRLVKAADVLPQGWSLLIFDGLRPLSVQKALYEQFRQVVMAERPQASPAEVELILDNFVARPVKRPNRPAPHTTGGAVDLTLCRNGVPLDMGTGFDDLTTLSHTDWLERACPPELEAARDNRRLLYHLMASVGLVNYPYEWWHYAYGERQWAVRAGKAPIYGFCPECEL